MHAAHVRIVKKCCEYKIILVLTRQDNGRRRPGRPMKTWQTTFNEDLRDMGLNMDGCKEICQRQTDRNGESSSPDVPAGTGGTKGRGATRQDSRS